MKATFYALFATAVTLLASGCSDSNMMGPDSSFNDETVALEASANSADCGPGEHETEDAFMLGEKQSITPGYPSPLPYEQFEDAHLIDGAGQKSSSGKDDIPPPPTEAKYAQ